MRWKRIHIRRAAVLLVAPGLFIAWRLAPAPTPAQANPGLGRAVAGSVPVATPTDFAELAALARAQPDPSAPIASDIPDLFALPGPQPDSAHSPGGAGHPDASGVAPPKTFSRRLDGVILGERRMACLDGHLYREGAIIDGFALVRIRRGSVTLRRDEEEITLTIPAPGEPENPQPMHKSDP